MFGLDNFGLAMVAFLAVFMTTGLLSYKYGLRSSGTILSLAAAMIAFLDVGTDILAPLTPAFFPDVAAGFPSIFVGLLILMWMFKGVTR